jgi:acid stress-induced BolA-like protein IbaG/YrbA
MLSVQLLKSRIEAALPGSQVEVQDTTGTGDHFDARVVSAAFAGRSMVEQHQLVYAPLQDLLQTGELHALSLKTYSPDAWARSTQKR